jgi:putative transposase
MQQVERHIILDKRFEAICFKSGLLYNFVTYHYRQAVFGKQAYFGEYELSKLCVECNQEDYRALPAQTAQQVIKLVFKNFKSYFASLKEYKKEPSKFLGKPKLPTCKTGKKQHIVIFTNQTARLKDGFIHFPKSVNLPPHPTKVDNFQQVRIVPMATCYAVEIVYEKEEKDLGLSKENVLSIDLGLNNYCVASNNVGLAPFIINGRVIKSFNHWFNKRKAKFMSYIGDKGTSKRLKQLNNYRNCWIEDKNHKISRHIIDYCIANNIGRIIVGKNENWKQNLNLGKKTNQKFTQVPHAKLIDKIAYKAKLVNIVFETTEESYTSKIDHLAGEAMKKQDQYLGKRVKRGLFQSSIGKLLNADVNGAIGIGLKKVRCNSFVKKIVDSGFVFNPYSITIT